MPSANDRSRNIVRGLGSLTVQNITTSLLGFVFLAVLLRLVSPADYTAYSSVNVSAAITVTVALFGLQYAAARFIPFYMSQNENEAFAVARSIILLSLAFSAAAAAAFALLTPFLQTYFMKSSSWTSLFLLGSLMVFANSLAQIFSSIIQGLRRYTFLAKMTVVSRIVMLIFTIAGLELFRTVSIAIIAWIVYYCLVITLSMSVIWGKASLGAHVGNYYRTVLKYCYPLAVAGILTMVASNGDLVIVGGFTKSLGVYNAVIQISSVLSAISISPLLTTLLPEASFSSRSVDEVSNGVRLATRFIVLTLLPTSLLAAALARQLLTLFSGGGAYLVGIGSLELLAVSYVLVGIQNIVYYILLATGRSFQALIVGGITTLADLAISLLLVPRFGIFGGAITRVVVDIFGIAIATLFIRNYLHLLDKPSFYAKGIVASLVPFIIVLALSYEVSSRTISLIPYSLLWAGLILLMYRFLKLVSEEDRSFISHILPQSLHRLLRYI